MFEFEVPIGEAPNFGDVLELQGRSHSVPHIRFDTERQVAQICLRALSDCFAEETQVGYVEIPSLSNCVRDRDFLASCNIRWD